MSYRVAVVGASGLVGREIVGLLEERRFPVRELALYATDRSAGERVGFAGDEIAIQRLQVDLFDADVAFLAAPPEVSDEIAEELADRGIVVVDTSRFHRDHAPAALADWNAEEAAGAVAQGGIVRVPNPLATLLARPLRVVAAQSPLVRVRGSCMIPASAFGDASLRALHEESLARLGGREPEDGPPRAFTCVPEDDGPGGIPLGEIGGDLRSILDLATPVELDAVRVPVFYGLGAWVHVEVRDPVSVEELAVRLREAPSVLFQDEGGADTLEAVAADATVVSRLEAVGEDGRSLRFWTAGDSVRLGAALASVTLAERILRDRSAR